MLELLEVPAWQVAVVAVVMGILTWAALSLSQLLAGISEQEEGGQHAGCSQDDTPTPSTTPVPVPHLSRSLQATPEKHYRDTSRERDVTSTLSRRRRTARRSLSLPTGSLSYGDVKISYRDGHFVTEPIGGETGAGGVEDRSLPYERTRSESSAAAAVLSGSRMNIGSNEEMRDEILSLLDRGFSTDDITLLFSSYLDQNSNQLGGPASSTTSHSTQSLITPGLYSSSSSSSSHQHTHHYTHSPHSLPRRRGRGHREGRAVSRPVSVEESNWPPSERFTQSELNLVSGESADCEAMRRTDSFYQAMTTSLVPGRVVGEGVEGLEGGHRHRHDPDDEARTDQDKSRPSHRPGFIQRMLQKRKAVHDGKPGSANGRPSKEEALPSSKSKESSRKVSIKSIFKRKNTAESKKEGEEESGGGESVGPPIATFMNDDDIDALSVSPADRSRGDCPSGDVLVSLYPGGGDDHVDGPSSAVLRRRERQPLTGDSNRRVSERYSGEYSDCDPDQAWECRSSQDTLTPRSTSSSDASTLTLEGGSFSSSRSSLIGGCSSSSNRSSMGEVSNRSSLGGEESESFGGRILGSSFGCDLSAWEDAGANNADSTLLASPGSLDRTLVSVDCRTPGRNPGQQQHHPPSCPQGGPTPSSPPPPPLAAGGGDHAARGSGGRKGSGGKQGEVITSSNSNDSGIQHDAVVVGSTESLKIPPEIASLTSAVKLRQSPSPKQERPKSDFTVRWADLLEQVKEADVIYRRDGVKLRRRPRPKSDLGGSSLRQASSADPANNTPSRRLGGALGALGLGSHGGSHGGSLGGSLGGSGTLWLGAAGIGGAGAGAAPQYDSNQSLVEFRRPGGRGRLDAAAARLAKTRRMSTPQPIKTRSGDKVAPRSARQVNVVRSSSMPDNLDRLHRKKNYFSLIGGDMHGELNHRGVGYDDDSSDESELSMDYQREKSLSTRASRVTLATLDMMIEEENLTYAEALWDHVTMDPDELGFRAGDLLRVTDMSDKHWWYGATQHRDGWFPAAFVRLRVNQDDLEAEMTLRIQEEEEEEKEEEEQQQQQRVAPSTSFAPATTSKTQLRANVVNEILTAEAEYVKHLRDVIEGYVKQTRKRPEMFPEDKVKVIFSNIDIIYDFATKLLGELQSAVNKEHPHLTEFGHCFLDKTRQFEIYSEYCNNHPAACEELREMYRVKRYRHFFEACRLLQEMTEIPLEGFLLTPVQKICKYHLQLAELLKYTPDDHPDHPLVSRAVDAMRHIAKLVNERKRKMESIETLAQWQMMVDDWEGPDILDDSSELIYSGELNKINANGWSQDRYFFLFDHQLVYCKKDLLKKNSFVYKGRVSMDQSIVVSIQDGRDMQYNVTVRNAFKVQDVERDKWYLMTAKTAHVKQRWLKAFSDERRRVHEDLENDFNIPHHLKQAIVSSLKQKSNSKSKGKRNASRSSSLRSSKTSSWTSAHATLPRIPRKSAMTAGQDSGGQQSNRIMNFLLGGKKK